MKPFNINQLSLLFILSFLGFGSQSVAQQADAYAKSPSPIIKGWSLTLNGGSNLFWGDIKQYQYWPVYQHKNEWGYAYGATLEKDLSSVFGLRVQFINGKLSGTRRQRSTYFTSDVRDLSGQLSMNFTNLFMPNKPYKMIETYGLIGIGLSDWATNRFDINTDQVIASSGFSGNGPNNRTTEIFAPIGFGIDINLSPNVALNFENTWRIVNSDFLDAASGGFAYDMYTYTSMGLKFNFSKNKSNRKKKEYKYSGDKVYNYIQEEQKNKKTPTKKYTGEEIRPEIRETYEKYDLVNEILQTQIAATMPKIISQAEELLITIIIRKPDLFGAGTIRQDLPNGSKIVDYDVKGAKITLSNNILSIFWYEMPKESEVKITYVVNTRNIQVGTYKINGIFTYYQNNMPELLSFNNTIIVERGNGVDNTYLVPDDKGEDLITKRSDKDIKDAITKDIDRYKNNWNKEAIDNSSNNNNLNKDNSNINEDLYSRNSNKVKYVKPAEYRVQIRAKYGRRLSTSALRARYKINEKIYENNYKGYYIYTVGSFDNYEEAEKLRDKIRRNNISDAFIVAFRKGQRLDSLSEL